MTLEQIGRIVDRLRDEAAIARHGDLQQRRYQVGDDRRRRARARSASGRGDLHLLQRLLQHAQRVFHLGLDLIDVLRRDVIVSIERVAQNVVDHAGGELVVLLIGDRLLHQASRVLHAHVRDAHSLQ